MPSSPQNPYNPGDDERASQMGEGAEELAIWNPKRAVEALAEEHSVFDSEKDEETASRLLCETAPQVALSMIHMALNARSESIRLNASKYVLDRVLGPPRPKDPNEGEDGPIEVLVKQLEALGATHS